MILDSSCLCKQFFWDEFGIIMTVGKYINFCSGLEETKQILSMVFMNDVGDLCLFNNSKCVKLSKSVLHFFTTYQIFFYLILLSKAMHYLSLINLYRNALYSIHLFIIALLLAM